MSPAENDSELELKKARLRAALAGRELTAEVTTDEVEIEKPVDTSRDVEFRANKPPHHG